MLIRMASPQDREQIANIYRAASEAVQGISRRPHEITETYIFSLLRKTNDDIVFLVAIDDDAKGDEEVVIGFVHAINSGLDMYKHILSDLTVMVDPSQQNKGIGKVLGYEFLKHIAKNRPDIKRVEMEALSEYMHLETYKNAGFVKEGEIKERVRNIDGSFSDSILLVWINPYFKA